MKRDKSPYKLAGTVAVYLDGKQGSGKSRLQDLFMKVCRDAGHEIVQTSEDKHTFFVRVSTDKPPLKGLQIISSQEERGP